MPISTLEPGPHPPHDALEPAMEKIHHSSALSIPLTLLARADEVIDQPQG